jgi:hypothetical protein
MHWQIEQLESVGAVKTRDLLRQFQADRTPEGACFPPAQARYLQDNLDEVRLYDRLTAAPFDRRDALGELIKKAG